MAALRRRALAVLAIGTSVAVGVACSTFSSSDEPSPDPREAGSDAQGSNPEASTDAGAAPDAAPDVVNLLSNGDFEIACAGWTGGYSALTEDPLSRSGKSCRVCAAADSNFSIGQSAPALAGRTYVFEAYVRAAEEAGAPTGALEVDLRVADLVEGGTLARTISNTAIPTSQWQRVAGLLADASTGRLEVNVLSGDYGTAGNRKCFLIDDALLYEKH